MSQEPMMIDAGNAEQIFLEFNPKGTQFFIFYEIRLIKETDLT